MESSDEEMAKTRPSRENRMAKKSTATQQAPSPAQPSSSYTTRRQTALASGRGRGRKTSDRFIENFNPETSAREKRKLNRKISSMNAVRRPAGAIYDENGVHIQTQMDLCDCLTVECPGCFMKCAKCSSTKCGLECRVHRKHIVEQIEYHGYDHVIKSPLFKH